MQGKDVSDFNKPDIFCFPNKCWNKVWATFANIIMSRQVKSSINEILHQVQKILVQGKYKPDCNKLSGFRFSEICWNKSGLPSEMSAGPVHIFCDTTQSFLFLSLRFTAYAFMCTWWNMVSAPPPKHSTFASAPVNCTDCHCIFFWCRHVNFQQESLCQLYGSSGFIIITDF